MGPEVPLMTGNMLAARPMLASVGDNRIPLLEMYPQNTVN